MSVLVGLISDTHGFLDPRAVAALAGADLVMHAGDIGSEEVLKGLAQVAPVTAVAGNNDAHLAYLGLPLLADVSLGGARIHVVHRLQDAAPSPKINVVVFGHSHKALIDEREGRLYVNPGAAGRRGFHRELTVALLRVDGGRFAAEIVLLGTRTPPTHPV